MEEASKPKPDPDAFANYRGPTAKPNISNNQSPVKSQSSKVQLTNQEDPEPDD